MRGGEGFSVGTAQEVMIYMYMYMYMHMYMYIYMFVCENVTCHCLPSMDFALLETTVVPKQSITFSKQKGNQYMKICGQ